MRASAENRCVARPARGATVHWQYIGGYGEPCAQGRPHTTLEEVRGVMKNRRIRHMPITDEADQLLGMVSIGDLNAHESNAKEMTIHLMEQYIYGQV